jgi:hypothetical protein
MSVHPRLDQDDLFIDPHDVLLAAQGIDVDAQGLELPEPVSALMEPGPRRALVAAVSDLTRVGFVGWVEPEAMAAITSTYGGGTVRLHRPALVGTRAHMDVATLRRYEPVPDPVWQLLADDLCRLLAPRVAYAAAVQADARGASLTAVRLLERAVSPAGGRDAVTHPAAVGRLAALYRQLDLRDALRASAAAGACGANDTLAAILLDDLAEVSRLPIAQRTAAREALTSELVALARSGSEWAATGLPQHLAEQSDAAGVLACVDAGLPVPEWLLPEVDLTGEVRWPEPFADVDDADLAACAAEGDPAATTVYLARLADAGDLVAWRDFAQAHPARDLRLDADDVVLEPVIADLADAGVAWAVQARRAEADLRAALYGSADEDALGVLGFDEGNTVALRRLAASLAARGNRPGLLRLSRAGVASATQTLVDWHPGAGHGLWRVDEAGAVVPVPATEPALSRSA